MPRYDDRYGTTRLYVGRLSSRTRSRDLEYLFTKYGRVREVEIKRDYAFIEFSDPRDAEDARYNLDGRDVDGSRIIVEFARGGPRGPGGSREYLGKGPPPGTGRCFNCGIDGHWARDCKAGDWKNKCYRCGDRGHIERNCQNSPKDLRRERSYSRSPSPRRGRGRDRDRSYSRSHSRSHSRSYSRSRSPRREVLHRERERSRSPIDSRSPSRSPPPKNRHHSPSPGRSPSPKDRDERNGSDYGGGSPPAARSTGSGSPPLAAANGRAPTPGEDDQNGDDDVRNDEADDSRASPRGGSESPRD